MVYHDQGFATVARSKCDCTHHKGPCQFVKLISVQSKSGEVEIVTRSMQTSLSWKPISFIQQRYNIHKILSIQHG